MQSYDIAFIGTIEANSYEEALEQGHYLAAGVGDSEQLAFSVVRDFEYDNDGQRVLYLDAVEEA